MPHPIPTTGDELAHEGRVDTDPDRARPALTGSGGSAVRGWRRWLVAIGTVVLLALLGRSQKPTDATATPPLRETIGRLSGPGGYFDTDNLISNEATYGRIIDRLEPVGGAYIGVGPEQNFSYIARTRPRWAFIVDIRRDNMLQHLLLNAILAHAESPFEYLCLLFSRPPPVDPPDVRAGSPGVAELVERLEERAPSPIFFEQNLERLLHHIENEIGFPLSPEDRETIREMHQAFFDHQLDLRFQTHGRPLSFRHPTYRTLLLERSPAGRAASFLGSSDDYTFVRRLALEARLVPVVGDLAGDHALRAVGRFLRGRGETVSTFYTSNVEFYLLRSGRYDAFVENVRSLPITKESLLLRAYFDYGRPHPTSDGRERSTLVLQRIRSFLGLYDAGAYRDYWDVCTRDYLH
jgi:hypothetical protein